MSYRGVKDNRLMYIGMPPRRRGSNWIRRNVHTYGVMPIFYLFFLHPFDHSTIFHCLCDLGRSSYLLPFIRCWPLFLKNWSCNFVYLFTIKFLRVCIFNRSFRPLLHMAGFSRSYSLSRFRLFWRVPFIHIFIVIVVTILSDQNGSSFYCHSFTVCQWLKLVLHVRPSIVDGGDRWEQTIISVSVQAPIDGLSPLSAFVSFVKIIWRTDQPRALHSSCYLGIKIVVQNLILCRCPSAPFVSSYAGYSFFDSAIFDSISSCRYPACSGHGGSWGIEMSTEDPSDNIDI